MILPMGYFATSIAFPGDRSPMTTKTVEFLESPALQGTLQAFGGVIETSVGAGLTFGSGGLLSAIGFPIMAHGMDQALTGGHMAFTGRPRYTATSQMLQKAGMSPEAAQLTDAGIGVIATMGAAGAIQGTRATALPTFKVPASVMNPLVGEALPVANYSGIPKNIRASRLAPHPEAQGFHSSFKQNISGKIQKYETYRFQTNPKNPNPWETTKRYDGLGGPPHWNKVLKEKISTPHVHDPLYPGGVRSPLLWEIPK